MGKNLSWRPENTKKPRSFGKDITFGRHRDSGTGYMSHSERAGPGVLVLHEFFGLTDSFRNYADRLCDEGFTALCVDLYDGAVAGSAEEAQSRADGLDEESTMLKLEAAAEHLRANWHPRVGVIGFSMGAYFATQMSQRPKLDAAVLYYGTGPMEAPRLSCPLLGHFAETDEYEPLEEVKDQFEKLEAEGAEVEMSVYPGTGHWFANSDVPEAFDALSAEEAWSSTVAFLRYHLA